MLESYKMARMPLENVYLIVNLIDNNHFRD